MRLSTKGRYAVMAMADLARNGTDRAVSLSEIATRQEISLSYLEQGAHETVVAEIVFAVDEPIRATRCTGETAPRGCMLAGERCITHNLWADLGDEIHRFLAQVSLEDVVLNRTGARRRAAGDDNIGAAA